MTQLVENLTKARDSARFTANDLHAALADAGAVEGIILMRLIDQAATLASGIDMLLQAVRDDGGAA